MSEQVRAGTWLIMGAVVQRENSGCGGSKSANVSSDHRLSILPPGGHGFREGRSLHSLREGRKLVLGSQ